MVSTIGSRNICVIIMSPLIINGPIFRIMNGPDSRSAVYLALALAGLKVGVKCVLKKGLYLKKLNLKITHLKTVQVNWFVHCADDSIILPYIIFVSFQSRGR